MYSGLIAVVGVCTSGKTTLVNELRDLGYNAVNVAQEHSHVPYLWSLRRPDFLVLLDCTYETARKRRLIYWGADRLEEQRKKLAHARQHCNLFIQTDDLTIAEVRQRVVQAVEGLYGNI